MCIIFKVRESVYVCFCCLRSFAFIDVWVGHGNFQSVNNKGKENDKDEGVVRMRS